MTRHCQETGQGARRRERKREEYTSNGEKVLLRRTRALVKVRPNLDLPERQRAKNKIKT